MKISYTKEFIRKSSIVNYPMTGYWIQFGQRVQSKSWYYQWILNSSNIYACNTFITKDHLRFSFTVDNYNDQSNISHYIYIFALDNMQYDSITEFHSKDPRLFTQLAAIIDLEVSGSIDVINKKVTNIFELDYIPKCSFNCLASNGQIQVDHYNSDLLGQSSYYNDLIDNQFIDNNSGLDKVRETLSYNRPSELLGNMTIRKSGLIQL